MAANYFTNCDAQGEDEERQCVYGVYIQQTSSSKLEEMDPEKLDIRFVFESFEPWGLGSLPYSNFDVIRLNFHLCGRLSGNREELNKAFIRHRVPGKAMNDIFRLLYDDDTLIKEPVVVGLLVRIEYYFPSLDRFAEEEEEEEQVSIGKRPATREAVEALEKVTIRIEEEDDDMKKRCAVCLEEYSAGMEVTKMPCSHVFHNDCIVTWLNNQCFCPMCRFKLNTTFNEDEDEDEDDECDCPICVKDDDPGQGHQTEQESPAEEEEEADVGS